MQAITSMYTKYIEYANAIAVFTKKVIDKHPSSSKQHGSWVGCSQGRSDVSGWLMGSEQVK